MGRKIFVSYKHSDSNVYPLQAGGLSTAADYLINVEDLIGYENVYKGEDPGADIGNLSDDAIADHLKDKIRDSSVTIILISRGMKETGKAENKQWIPWEISYSLKEIERGGTVSRTNAMLSVILPDQSSNYSYMKQANCSHVTWYSNHIFPIMWKNMFNKKEQNIHKCSVCLTANIHCETDPHYIPAVTWQDFLYNHQNYIDHAVSICEQKDDYKIAKKLTES